MSDKNNIRIASWSKEVAASWGMLSDLYAEAKLYILAEKCKRRQDVASEFKSIIEAKKDGNKFFGIKD